MLLLIYSEYLLILSLLYFFLFSWYLYFKINFYSVKINTHHKDKLLVPINKHFKAISPNIILKLNALLIIMLLLLFFSLNQYSDLFWWNHFKINNFLLYLVICLLNINLYFIAILIPLNLKQAVIKYEYVFSLLNLSIFIFLILLSNTLYSFFFLLEVNSIIIFLKFLMSRTWFKDKDNINLTKKLNQSPKSFLSMLFFQFWTSFFSSTLLVFLIIYLIFSLGTSEWLLMNFLLFFEKNQDSNYFLLSLMFFLLLVSFFTKLGITPIHFYKIEVYKGINFISIFFYTTFYFIVFLIYFLNLLLVNFNFFFYYFWYILTFLIVIGFFLVISLLFDINYIKAFLAYSSIINSLNFIVFAQILIC